MNTNRKVDGRETLGLIADLTRDFKHTRDALLNATPETLTRRADLAEHCGHRVELRYEDGTVAARGELATVTVVSARLVRLEAGQARVPLGEVASVVRLQARRDAGVYPVVVRDGGAK